MNRPQALLPVAFFFICKAVTGVKVATVFNWETGDWRLEIYHSPVSSLQSQIKMNQELNNFSNHYFLTLGSPATEPGLSWFVGDSAALAGAGPFFEQFGNQ
jgi:hypothetical protein